MRLTIKDIAKMCDVSVTTVSRVLNKKTNNISAETVRRVEEKIREVGYVPNSVARSMITKKTHSVGLVIPDIRNPFFSELARGIEDYMHVRNYGIFLCNTDSSLEKEKQYINHLRGRFSDGIMFTTQNNDESPEYFEQLLKSSCPIVLIDRYMNGSAKYPGVYLDNLGGAEKICDFIIAKGHKKIACITGPLETTNAKMRLQGYRNALVKAGLEVDESFIKFGNYRYSGGYNSMKSLLAQNQARATKEQFTAVFACNDMMAYGAYSALEEAGLRVPDDISLAGFDNIKFPEVLTPKITSVELPAYDMGQKAADLLMKMMRNEPLQNSTFEYSLDIVDKGSIQNR